jgi:hypothetical protein
MLRVLTAIAIFMVAGAASGFAQGRPPFAQDPPPAWARDRGVRHAPAPLIGVGLPGLLAIGIYLVARRRAGQRPPEPKPDV